MRRVSFEIAKALKEAGYPQDWDNTNARYILKDFRIVTRWYREGEFLDDEDSTFGDCAIAPTYIEVWLWLWREKKYAITLECIDNKDWATGKIGFFGDPEDAIIAEIQHIVDCKLLELI